MTGVVVLIVAVLAAAVLGVAYRRTNGVFRGARSAAPHAAEVSAGASGREAASAPEVVTADDVDATLGERATLLQFSSAFCAPCRATRRVLAEVAELTPGVVHVEVDAESHLDLVRRLDIRRTPTTLVLDATGTVTRRASGLPQRDQVLVALADAI